MGLDTLSNGRKSTKGKLRARPARVLTDPQMRDDRVCIRHPDCDKPLTEIAVANEDPFCTTACCRIWYCVTDQGRPR